MEYRIDDEVSQFDAMVRQNGNSKIITIPVKSVEKLKLKLNEIIVVVIKKGSKYIQ